MSSIWKDCAFSFIDNYVKRETEIKDKRRIQSPNHYFSVLAKRENKFIGKTDFSLALQTAFPDSLLVFNDKQRENLDKIANFIESPEEFAVHLQLIAKVVDDFRNADAMGDPIYLVSLQNYQYMLKKLKAKYPHMYARYQQIITKVKEKSQEIESRPPCPRCGSNDVKKWSSWRFRCNSCGRTFTRKHSSP